MPALIAAGAGRAELPEYLARQLRLLAQPLLHPSPHERHHFGPVEQARDGVEVLQKVKECRPDLMVLDFLMPRKSRKFDPAG